VGRLLLLPSLSFVGLKVPVGGVERCVAILFKLFRSFVRELPTPPLLVFTECFTIQRRVFGKCSPSPNCSCESFGFTEMARPTHYDDACPDLVLTLLALEYSTLNACK